MGKINIKSLAICQDWNKYLEYIDSDLKALGFRKQKDIVDKNDVYYKSYGEKYVIGVHIFDFRPHISNKDDSDYKIRLMFECRLDFDDNIIKLEVSHRVNLEIFEDMSEEFYKTMIKYE